MDTLFTIIYHSQLLFRQHGEMQRILKIQHRIGIVPQESAPRVLGLPHRRLVRQIARWGTIDEGAKELTASNAFLFLTVRAGQQQRA